ncbi:response regulator [Xinfangfangia pollutisoli]|uniref:response regulator n=1 Tax=Xinfangfangia pollutisoli TaxID=2865960 RepID=UPI001CD80570|nr:response regulator [Xinfangfangia pollutisoli]
MEASARPIRILVADDDEINRAIVGHLIATLPEAMLTEAADGRAALELAQTQRFDVLIFDLNMPEIKGDRLIRHLRASQSLNAASAMVLFSAAADASGQIPGNTASALADLVLPKPIRAEAFLTAIRGLAQRG